MYLCICEYEETKRKVIEPVNYVYHWNTKHMKKEVRSCCSKSCLIPLLDPAFLSSYFYD